MGNIRIIGLHNLHGHLIGIGILQRHSERRSVAAHTGRLTNYVTHPPSRTKIRVSIKQLPQLRHHRIQCATHIVRLHRLAAKGTIGDADRSCLFAHAHAPLTSLQHPSDPSMMHHVFG